MISELFDSIKGESVYNKRTICEVHREIYDMVVLNMQDKQEEMLQIIKLLEEAYLFGIKMNAKLIEYKCNFEELTDKNYNQQEILERRRKRIELIKILENNKKILKKGKENGKK